MLKILNTCFKIKYIYPLNKCTLYNFLNTWEQKTYSGMTITTYNYDITL